GRRGGKTRLAAPFAVLMAAALLSSCTSDVPQDDEGGAPAASKQSRSTGTQSKFFDPAAYERQLTLARETPQGPADKPWEQMLDPQMTDTSKFAKAGGAKDIHLCF
ncbi:ABC transporter substrate-binding protein, partial [Streptomyces sp. SID11233]|nr:ABC transporter substrate-binding protein [Streptomyces sp. SID11233]